MKESQLSYPYSYGDELTPEIARSNKNQIKKLIILIWLLKVSQVHAAQLPGAEGFAPVYLCHRRQPFYPRATIKEQHFNNQNRTDKTNIKEYVREFHIGFDNRQLQSKFKHAKDFGVSGNYNPKNRQLFKNEIVKHMREPSTQIIKGTYKKLQLYL